MLIFEIVLRDLYVMILMSKIYLVFFFCWELSVTHAVFPQESWKKFVGDSGFDTFYVTDSCPETINSIRNQKPFVVLGIAESLVNNLNDLI